MSALLIFRLAGQRYAFSIEGISEVMPLLAVQPIPFLPSHWLGVANIRGIVTPVIDLRSWLDLPPYYPTLSAPLIILKKEMAQAALLVDQIEQISHRLYQSEQSTNEFFAKMSDNTYMVTLLDPDSQHSYAKGLITLINWQRLLQDISASNRI
jgi:chemotaxis signal transduction protein